MKSLLSVILIPAVLIASVLPAYVYAAPNVTTDGPVAPVPGQPAAPEDEKHEEPDAPTTTAPPPVALTPRADSIEALERSLRSTADGKASTRLELLPSQRLRSQRKPARPDQLIRRARHLSTALRVVASRVRSHAPPAC